MIAVHPLFPIRSSWWRQASILVEPRQHSQRRDQDPLSLFHPHRPAAPALPQHPFADRALQADDVPDTAGWAAEPAER
jgi:hypothetical protein